MDETLWVLEKKAYFSALLGNKPASCGKDGESGCPKQTLTIKLCAP
jgi:hypothetical protein